MNGQLTQEKLDRLLLEQLTEEQKNAVVSRGGTILLSASAGSGKTSVLTSRIIKMITDRENPVDADRLLVLTFSNAAANEMKQRILQKINELLHDFPEDGILQRQQMLLNKAQISTIHSFCIGMLRENFDKIGFAPDFRIVEDSALEEHKEAVMRELLEEYYEQDDPVFLRLVRNFYTKSDQDRSLMEGIEQVYAYIRSNPFPLGWLDRCLQKYIENISASKKEWEAVVLEQAIHMAGYCLGLLGELNELVLQDEKYRERYQEFVQGSIRKFSEFTDILQEKNWGDVYAFAQSFSLDKVTHIRRNTKAYIPELGEQVTAICSQINEVIGDIRDKYINFTEQDFYDDVQQQLPEIEKLFELVREFYTRMRRMKAAANVMDFGDVEEYAVNLLAEEAGGGYRKTAVCQRYSDAFDEILVDEFQDTNRTQDLLFKCISREECNIFMVGDVKQSIYRFRKAMPEIFIENLNRFHPYDGKRYPANIIMARNFRSRKEVTNSINYIFRQIMSEDVGEIVYDHTQELVSHNDFTPVDGMETEIQVVDIPDKVRKEEAVAFEARHIASQIQGMVERKMLVQGKDKQLRPCTYGDFCVLLRSAKSKIPAYLKELNQLGMDVWIKEKGGFFSSREIALIIHLLKSIDNPTRDVSLAAIALSPLFGFSPDDLAAIQVLSKKEAGCLYQKLEKAAAEDTPLGERCRGFVSMLEHLRYSRIAMPVEELIQEIYDQTFALEIFGAMEFGKQRQANLRLLLQYAGEYTVSGNQNLSDFLRFVDRAVETNADIKIANTQLQNADAVKIMTIHNSKGLEFPVCFVADCGNGFNHRDFNKPILLGSDHGFAMKRFEPEQYKKYNTLAYTALSITNEKQMLSEEMRILYVALTRAKEKLILTGSIVGKGGVSALSKHVRTACLGLGADEQITSYKVYSARNYLEWLLMGAVRHPHIAGRLDTGHVLESLSENGQCTIAFNSFAPLPETEAKEKQAAVFSAEVDEDQYTHFLERMAWEYPHKALEDIPAKLSATQIAKESSFVFKGFQKRPEFMMEQSLTKAEIGTINHEFLQFADFASASRDLEGEIERLVHAGFLAQYKADKLDIKKLQAFFRSDTAGRMMRADELYREFKFMHEIPVSELYPMESPVEETILVQGIADCVFIEKDYGVIVDYKTDAVSHGSILAERYKKQLLLYKNALEKAFDVPITELIIYSLHLSEEIVLKDF